MARTRRGPAPVAPKTSKTRKTKRKLDDVVDELHETSLEKSDVESEGEKVIEVESEGAKGEIKKKGRPRKTPAPEKRKGGVKRGSENPPSTKKKKRKKENPARHPGHEVGHADIFDSRFYFF